MKVADLQQFLTAMTAPLTASGGKKAADDLEKAAKALETFREMSIADWAAFLEKADHFVKTGQMPTGKRASKSNPEMVKQASQKVMDLREKAMGADFNPGQAEDEVRQLEQLSLEELKLVGKEVGMTQAFRSKADALAALLKMIQGRRDGDESSPSGMSAPAEESMAAASDMALKIISKRLLQRNRTMV